LVHRRQQLARDSCCDQEGELRRLAHRRDGSALQIRAGSAVFRHGCGHRSPYRGNAVMKVSRRKFVGTAGCAAAASWCAVPSFAFTASDPARVGADCILLDLRSNCALPESFAGMQSALGIARHSVLESDFTVTKLTEFASSSIARRDSSWVVIVPAAGSVRAE